MKVTRAALRRRRMTPALLAAAALWSTDVRAAEALYSCEVTRLIVSTGKTSSTRRFKLEVRLNENDGGIRFDDSSRWGPTQIDVWTSRRIEGMNGPLQFHFDRSSGQLIRTLGGGGRSLLDTGRCVAHND